MKLSDFSVGQRVTLVRQANIPPSWENDRETWGLIKKIDKRYLHVAVKGHVGWIVLFDSHSSFRQKSDYSAEYILFLNHQSVLDYWTKLWVIHHVREMFSHGNPSLTNDQVLALAGALNLDPHGWEEEAPVYTAKEPRT